MKTRRNRNTLLLSCAFFALQWLLVLGQVSAQSVMQSWSEEYAKRTRTAQTISPYGSNLFGDSVNLFNGTVQLQVTDIDLPGNSSIPVRLSRRVAIGDSERKLLFGSWDLELPHLWTLSQPYTTAWGQDARCSQFSSVTGGLNEYHWNGVHLADSNGSGELVVPSTDPKLKRPTDGATYKAVTKSGWHFSCGIPLASGETGEGFVARSPDGLKYTFDWLVTVPYSLATEPSDLPQVLIVTPRVAARIYPTKVEDRFGNWVRYEWSGKKLLRIYANDGRQITLSYVTNPYYPTSNIDSYYPSSAFAKDRVASATANGRTWTYTYPANSTVLSSVVLPDASAWNYGTTGFGLTFQYDPTVLSYYDCSGVLGYQRCPVYKMDKNVVCTASRALLYQTYTFVITHPSGAQGAFSVAPSRQGRNNVTYDCAEASGDANRDGWYNMYAVFGNYWALTSKSIAGPGMTTQTWSYAIAGATGGYEQATYTPHYRTNTVTQPDGSKLVHTFGNDANQNEGQLASVTTSNASAVQLQSMQYGYITNAQAPGMPFVDRVGQSLKQQYPDDWSTTANRPLNSTVTSQQGVNFTRLIAEFDAFVQPLRTVKKSTLGYAKTEFQTYFDQLSAWVVSQPATLRTCNGEVSVICGGFFDSQVNYNATTALPITQYKFNKLQQSMTYNADGTLATVSDGRNLQTTLSNWKRGIPQQINFADATAMSAVVDDNGWLLSVTNQNGNKTCYGYDAMGRANLLTHPSEATAGVCDTSTWSATSSSFVPVAAAEYGIAAGHWKQTIATGNARKITYMDAQWRPLLVQEYDAANMAATQRFTRYQYDAEGRVTFAAYPSTSSNSTTGVSTEYDALGRATKVSQHSELGVLISTTQYLGGFQTQSTNPKNFSTTTSYLAYDSPATDQPLLIQMPESAVTTITRNVWGMPLSMARSGPGVSLTRSYAYNANYELCRQIEPETGATLIGYDAAGNVAWSSSGLGASTACEPDGTSAAVAARKVTRAYDNRNRLSTLTFPDGVGNQAWIYTPDGLPQQVTANNASWGSPVVTAYHYNARRLHDGQGETSSVPNNWTWSAGYGYDANGNQITQVYPTGLTVNFTVNALGQTQSITSSGVNYATGVTYYPNGAIKQFTYGNGIVHNMAQNQRQLPASTTDGTVSGLSYAYDANGNVSSVQDTARGTQYNRSMVYDGLDRLTQATSPSFGGDGNHRFTYNALDDITSWKLTGVKDYSTYSYDAGTNRLTTIRNSAATALVNLAYDPQGNLNNKNGQIYQFDYGNRLRVVANVEEYRYDGLGRRILAWSPTKGFIVSMYDHTGKLLRQLDYRKPGKENAESIYLSGSLLAIRRANVTSGVVTIDYQHTDALGSPVAVTNATGQVIDRTDWEPYGAAINKPGYSGQGYTGHVMDAETSMIYMQQRYYDPNIGRFLSTDPVQADANTGSMFNRYVYASNNPYRFTDPDGRCDNSPGSFCNFVKGIALAFRDSVAPIAHAIVDPDGSMIDASYDRLGPGSNPSTQGGYKFGSALMIAEGAKAPAQLAGAAVGAKAPIILTEAQAKNLARFESKLPSGNTGTTVSRTGNGVTFTSEVPGKVPGSQATYQKTVNAAGETTGYTKTTTSPSGQVIHEKDKFRRPE